MRVGIVGLIHESNTFCNEATDLSAFQRDGLLFGEEVRERFSGSNHEIAGFFQQLTEDRIDAFPIMSAWTLPSGTISRAAGSELVSRAMAAIRAAGHLDGILVAPHGAAVSDGEPDFDGFWLSKTRELVGNSVPLIGTLDLHANLSARMVESTEALLAYQTNPHIDQRQTGQMAAALMARTLRGEVRPTSAAFFPPFVMNIETQGTYESPCRELIAMADEIRQRFKVLAVNLLFGFPFADVAEMGVGVSVVTDDDPELARRYAIELGRRWWSQREQFRGAMTSVQDAVQSAANGPGPVCLLDMGDNIGGGSPANSTAIAQVLRRQNVGPSFVCLYDPISVERASVVGVGGHLDNSIGNSDDAIGGALTGHFIVRSLHDGRFEDPVPRHGGLVRYDQGRTAVVESQGMTVMLTSQRTPPFSLCQLTSFGIDPAQFQVLVAKGVHSPVAAYSPVCSRLIRVNSPGVTCADLAGFDYRNRRKLLYPFEVDFDWEPEELL